MKHEIQIIDRRKYAYERLRDKLLFGEFETDGRLSDVALAKEIGVSRTPVREALQRLASEGFIRQIPRYGAFLKQMDWQELEEIYHVRELLEGDAAERAASRLTSHQIDELKNKCDESRSILEQVRATKGALREGDVPQQWVCTDLSFHVLIFRASQNRKVMKIVSDMRMMTAMFGFKRYDPSDSLFSGMVWAYRQHCGILRALSRRDGVQARKLVVAHLQDSRRRTLRYYEWRKKNADLAGKSARPSSLREIIRHVEKYDEEAPPSI